MKPGYSVRGARGDEIDRLPEIESAAASLFADSPFANAVLGDGTPLEEFRRAQRGGRLWVAVSEEDGPVGFALVERVDGNAHLDELDVHPSHGRRGLGAALVRAVCEWAREQGLSAVTLTTYRDVPWNAPFYRRLGFRALGADELSPSLASLVRKESSQGLEARDRVVMRFETG